MTQRTLRSKRLRALLWYAADGKCQRCQAELGEDWEADHIVPWVKEQRTNVHEMQALCQKCNREKGASVLLRKHQAEMLQICREINAGGSHVQEIIASVVPGGGKSRLALVAAWQLIPKAADAICWIAPRLSLLKQGERVFADRDWRIRLPHNLSIRASGNDVNPCRGHQGYVTTYQAVAQNPDLHAHEFKTKRYILVLDESQHVERDGPWHRGIQPLVNAAFLVIYLSGTLERGNGQHIAFLPYRREGRGDVVDLTANAERAVIEYSRKDALAEKSIVELHFEVMDGRAEWVDREGKHRVIESIASACDDTSAAIETALATTYAKQLLDKTVAAWQGHRHVYPRAKLLVVAPRIEIARDYWSYLKEKGIESDIATSDDSPSAQLAIDRFKGAKKPQIDVLVTVAMAYEGLDVPEITHIACLTNYRSRPWLEQCFARANRIADGKTYGYVYAPDDEFFRKVIQEIRDEQEAVAREVGERDQNGGAPAPSEYRAGLLPLISSVTDQRATSLQHGEDLGYRETAAIQHALEYSGLLGASTIQARKFLLALGVTSLPNGPHPITANDPILTPSEQEKKLRNSIESYVRKASYQLSVSPKLINREIFDHYGKARDDMEAQELMDVWAYVQSRYPGIVI